MRTIFSTTIISLALFACTPSGQEDHQEESTAVEVAQTEPMVFPEDSVSEDGKMSFHGLRIDDADAVSLTEVKTVVAEKGGVTGVKVAAPIEAACQNKGCWMTVKLAEDEEMRVTFKDYGFFVPKDSPGKTAIMTGDVFYDTTTVERLRHFAVDGGMSEAEAEKTITEPEISMSFEATGVIIREEGE